MSLSGFVRADKMYSQRAKTLDISMFCGFGFMSFSGFVKALSGFVKAEHFTGWLIQRFYKRVFPLKTF